MKKATLIIFVILISSFCTYLLLPPQIPLSPKDSSNPESPKKSLDSKYVILGFAPYWNMKKITPESLNVITHFAYFALHLRGDGTLYTHVNKREEDPGFTNYKRLLKNTTSNNLVLTFMQEDQAALESVLSSESNRRTAIDTILTRTQESSASGINIDLEPVGDISKPLRDNFTLFIQELDKHLASLPKRPPLLTISIYPSAAAKARLWDLPALEPFTDYFVVMTYDYTMPKSKSAGPNSPLRDFSGEFEHNILKNLSELSKQIPSKKLLLGIPLYGYEWDTLDARKYSPTESRGVTASLERIEKMLEEKTLELVWDRNSLTPYGISSDSGTTSQIYFENETSIRLKLELVKSSGLGGIALWALGYDNNVPWLWPTIKSLQ